MLKRAHLELLLTGGKSSWQFASSFRKAVSLFSTGQLTPALFPPGGVKLPQRLHAPTWEITVQVLTLNCWTLTLKYQQKFTGRWWGRAEGERVCYSHGEPLENLWRAVPTSVTHKDCDLELWGCYNSLSCSCCCYCCSISRFVPLWEALPLPHLSLFFLCFFVRLSALNVGCLVENPKKNKTLIHISLTKTRI